MFIQVRHAPPMFGIALVNFSDCRELEYLVIHMYIIFSYDVAVCKLCYIEVRTYTYLFAKALTYCLNIYHIIIVLKSHQNGIQKFI